MRLQREAHSANVTAVLAIVAAAALLAVAQPVWSGAPDRALNGLDHYIEQVRGDWKNVGVAVAVVQGDKILYARGFGIKEVGKPDKIDAQTLFQVGSTSKAFTTAALGILVDEGKLHWDDPVIQYLPGFRLKDPWLTAHLTVRDTVVHDSGIPDSRFSSLGNMDLDTAVRQLRSIEAEAPFRNSFRYSNLMYATAGRIVQAVSGMTWQDFVARRVLEPLQMTRSGTTPTKYWEARYLTSTFLGSAPAGRTTLTQSRDANVAMPHAFDDKGAMQVVPWNNYDSKAAAGSIVSSAQDMARWLILHLNEGRANGRQLISAATMKELHTTQNLHGRDEFPFDETGTTYAMGWFKAPYRGYDYLYHGGGIIGFPAHVAILPQRKLGVVVLSNGPQGAWFHQAIELEVFDRLLGGAPRRDWNKEFLARAEAAKQKTEQAEAQMQQGRKSSVAPSGPLERYAGTYENSDMQTGRAIVRVTNGALTLAFDGEGAFAAPLEHWTGDLFRLRPNPGVVDSMNAFGQKFVNFTLDASGQVASVTGFGATMQRIAPDGVKGQ